MKFEELQQEWRAIKSEPRSHEEWKRMMYASPVSRFKKISRKELLKFIRDVIIFSLMVYLFDGLESWPSGIWTVYCAFVFLDEYVGIRYLSFTPQRDTIGKTLTDGLARIRVAALVSKVAHVLIWGLVVFSLGVNKTGSMNMLWWAMILLPLLVAISWWSGRKWSRKIGEVRQLLEGFNEESKIPVEPVI